MKNRTGLSRLEVVVVLLIIAVVGGLMLAAVLRVREAADLSRCKNHLKGIAMAIENYSLSSNGSLPPLADQGGNTPTGSGLPSLFFNILPFVEQSNLHGLYNESAKTLYYAHSSVVVFSKPATTGSKDDAAFTLYGGLANQILSVYVDPADGSGGDGLRDVRVNLPDGATGYYTTGSYAANGLVPWNTGSLPKSFPDGTANTILFAERAQVCHTAAGQNVYNLWGLGFYSSNMPAFATLTPDDPPGLLSTGQVAPVTPLQARDRADQILVRIGRENAPPQPPDFTTPVQMLGGARPCDPRLPASPHLGVMQTAMADGSVHVFARTVSPWVFWAACTPNGGEDLGSDW